MRPINRLIADRDGAALTEMLFVIVILVFVTALFVEFTVAVNQWNMTLAGLQRAARTASVSDPVDSSLLSITGLEGGASPGDPMPAFTSRVCTKTGGSGSCTSGGTFDNTAWQRIIGKIQEALPANRVTDDNLTVTYAYGGLGFAGRPGGPVPIVELTLSGVQFQLAVLGAFLPSSLLTMPPMTVSTIGEDLSTTYSP